MKSLIVAVSISAVLSTWVLAESNGIGSQQFNQPIQDGQGQGMRSSGDNRQDMRQERREENRQDKRQDMRQERREDGQGQGMRPNGDNRQDMRQNRGGGQGAGSMQRGKR